MTWRPRRSVLFTPATRADRWLKAVEAGAADVAVADLEDGVAPSDRTEARQRLGDALRDAPKTRTERAVRINPWPSSDASADLAVAPPEACELIVVPKVESADAVKALSGALDERSHPARLLLLVETARGVLHADRFPPASGRVVALGFGAEDYAATVGARRTHRATEVLWARSRVVAAAGAYGIDAIDQVYTDFKDLDGFAEECRFAAQLGYAGKMLIHPDQIQPVHDAFAPTDEQVAQARKILDAAEDAGAGSGGVVVVDGRMVDRPLIEQARRIARLADLA